MKRGMTAPDLIVYGLILLFATLQFAFSVRTAGVPGGDAVNIELARSIIEERPYGFNHKPETRFPPGFPLILAGISLVTGFHFGAMVRALSIFTALGFIVSYEMLRREEGRLCAATICLLLISSPHVFYMTTHGLATELPFFLLTFLVLLTSRKLAISDRTWERTVLWLCTAFAVIASFMVRTATVALLAGFCFWLAVSLLTEKKAALSRLKIFLPIVIIGILVHAWWTYRAAILEVREWPSLNGFPGSYFSEVLLKRGNYPELGNASLGDIVSTLTSNLIGYAVGLTKILIRKDYIVPIWFSPAVILPLFLVSVGIVSKLLKKRGGLPEWYFISYMAMFLLWPWEYDIRFFLPVAPLACLYLWCGIKKLYQMVIETPRRVGLIGLPICIVLTVFSAVQGSRIRGMQSKLSIFFWLVLSAFAILTLWRSPSLSGHSIRLRQWLFKETLWARELRVSNIKGIALAIAFAAVVIGLLMQIDIGRENLRFDYMRFTDVRAAQYVNLHTDRNAIIMAGHAATVYYYTRRRVIWFPPISNPEVLMDGIRRHKVNFIVVIDRTQQYWLPPERDCFQGLSKKYPEAFHLVYHDPEFDIYEVSNETSHV
jgi:hypothetical protein